MSKIISPPTSAIAVDYPRLAVKIDSTVLWLLFWL